MKIKNNFYIRVPYFGVNNFEKISKMNSDELINFNKDNFLEGLMVESKDLYYSLKEKKGSCDLIASSLHKYLLRATTRTTPHGLSVRILEGCFTNKTEANFNQYNDFKTLELDFEWCLGILKIIECNNFKSLQVILNNHIEINNDFVFNKWIDCCCEKKDSKINIILDKKEPLEEVIKLIKNSRLSIEEIGKHLKRKYCQVSDKKIYSFLKELLENEIICSDLRITMSDKRTVKWLLDKIKSYDINKEITNRLMEIDDLIQDYEKAPINHSSKKLERIIELMKSLKISSNYLCVNLYNADQIFLENEIQEELRGYICFLNKIALGKRKNDDYYNHFIDKYGFQAVNIQDVVDSINGIGFPKPIDIQQNEYYSKIRNFILSSNEDEVDLYDVFNNVDEESENEFKEFELAFKIYRKNNKNYYETTPIVGSNQLYKIIGRFKELEKEPIHIENCDTVEIIYYPKIEKVGNVLSCTTTADYILDYGNTQITDKKKILLEDIYIYPYMGKLVFVNRSNGRRIKFVNTNMTTLKLMPDLLNGLINISNRYDPDPFTLHYILQDVLKGLSFQKRITYKNFILKVKTLELCKEEIQMEYVAEYIKNKLHKNIVLCGIRDNLLLLNLDVKEHLGILGKMLNQNEVVLVQDTEVYNFPIISNEKKELYIGEYIFEIYNDKKKYEVLPKYNYLPNLDDFQDNQEVWVSFKLYMPTAYMDRFLYNHLYEFIKELKKKEMINSFFFLRYFDSEYHLRVRILVNKQQLGNLFKICYEYFNQQKESGYIKKIIVDEYVPELVRYGGKKNIKYVENIFRMSSIYSIEELKKNKDKNELRENYILLVYLVCTKIDYDFNKIIDEFNKYASFYKRSGITDTIRKKIILFEKEELSYTNLFDNLELDIINLIINEINAMILNKFISYDELPSMLTSIFHMHFNRLMGIDRVLENELNGCVENILYTFNKLFNKS